MDRMSLYYFTRERQTIENRKKLLKLLAVFLIQILINKY